MLHPHLLPLFLTQSPPPITTRPAGLRGRAPTPRPCSVTLALLQRLSHTQCPFHPGCLPRLVPVLKALRALTTRLTCSSFRSQLLEEPSQSLGQASPGSPHLQLPVTDSSLESSSFNFHSYLCYEVFPAELSRVGGQRSCMCLGPG